MPAITITDLNNAKLDVDHIAAIATSLSDTATDRLGHTKNTIYHAMTLIDADVLEVDDRAAAADASIDADVLEVDDRAAAADISIDAFVQAVSDRSDEAIAVDIPAIVATLGAMNNRGAWVTATAYTYRDIVSNSGTWYVCVVPHTSSALFATDVSTKWRVYQGITTGDLLTSAGAGFVGYNKSTSYPASTVGKKLQESVSVKEYGATGNGATDDSAAIQAAIDANPGRSIYFPGGTYKILTTLTVTVDNTRLVGAGANATFLNNSTTNGDAIRIYCTSTATTTTFINGCGIQGIYIYRNTSATSGASLRITQANGGTFEDFISSNCPEGVVVEGGQFNRFNRFNLFASGSTFDLSGTSNSALMTFKEAPIDGGLFQYCFTTTVSDFRCTSSKKTETIFHVASSDGLQFSNAYVASAYYSMVKIKGLRDGGKVAGLNFSNIYFDAVNSGTGTSYIVDVPTDAYSSFTIYDASFTGCILGNTKFGGIVARKSIHKLNVTGCTFINTNTWPIDFEGSSSTSNVNITGNQFNYVGVTAGGTGTTRVKDVVSLVFSGNTIVNDMGVGATLNLTGTINVAAVTGNTVKGNSADISYSSATFTTGLTISGNTSNSTNGASSWMGVRLVNLNINDSKTLDWYEEGTGSSGVTFGGAAVGVTYSVNVMRFTRIGNRVMFQINLTLTSKGSSTGTLAVTGLPYTSNSQNVTPCSVRLNGVTSGLANVMLYGLVAGSTQNVQIAKSDGASSLTVLTDGDILGTASIYVSGHYGV